MKHYTFDVHNAEGRCIQLTVLAEGVEEAVTQIKEEVRNWLSVVLVGAPDKEASFMDIVDFEEGDKL